MGCAPQGMRSPSVVQGMGWVGVRVEVTEQKGCRRRYLSLILEMFLETLAMKSEDAEFDSCLCH